MDELLLIVQTINSYLSNYVLIILLISMGVFFTIRTRGVQFRCFGEGMRRVFGADPEACSSLFAPALCRFAALAKALSDCLVDST